MGTNNNEYKIGSKGLLKAAKSYKRNDKGV